MMRALPYLLFLLLCFAVNGVSGQGYTIAFYNVENLFDTLDDPDKFDEEFTPAGAYRYTDSVYGKKLNNIARVLADMGTEKDTDGPDMIGLAEVENNRVLKDLAACRAIKYRGYKYVWHKGPDARGITTALLYNPKHFKPFHSEAIPVPLRGDTTRDVLWVSGILGKDTTDIFVNHWPSRREGKELTEPKRLAAARMVADKVSAIQLAKPGAQIIVMGDFNDDPDDKSLKLLTAPGSNLINPWTSISTDEQQGTSYYKRRWNRFDQILLSGSFYSPRGLRLTEMKVFAPDYLFTRTGKFKGYPHRSFGGTRWLHGYSDHLPVFIYVDTANK